MFGIRLFDRVARVRIFVEILKVCCARQFWHPWRLNFLLFNHVPVDSSEPNVCLYVFRGVYHAAETFGEILLEEAAD